MFIIILKTYILLGVYQSRHLGFDNKFAIFEATTWHHNNFGPTILISRLYGGCRDGLMNSMRHRSLKERRRF